MKVEVFDMLVNEKGKVMGADNSAKDCCPDSWERIIEDCASKYESVIRGLRCDNGILLSESPQKVWNSISEDVGCDMSDVLCPELFTKEKPNGYTPNLDYVMSQIWKVVKSRMEDGDFESVTPFEAELYGVYCALFLRAHMEDILSQEVIEDYPCLYHAVDYITYHCGREEIRFFWCGFESYFPITTHYLGMYFLRQYSSTDFGSLMVSEFLAYCDMVKSQLEEIVIPDLEEMVSKLKEGMVLKEYRNYYDSKFPD